MEAIYIALANGVLIVHVIFAVWVFAGGMIAHRTLWLRWAHLASLGWAGIAITTGIACPSTLLENRFRLLGGGAAYDEECIPHYVWTPLGIEEGVATAVVLISLLVILNGVAYRKGATMRRRAKPGS